MSRPLSARSRVVVHTICVFDAVILFVVGVILALFVDRPAGPIAGAVSWVGAGGLLALAGWIDRQGDWRWR